MPHYFFGKAASASFFILPKIKALIISSDAMAPMLAPKKRGKKATSLSNLRVLIFFKKKITSLIISSTKKVRFFSEEIMRHACCFIQATSASLFLQRKMFFFWRNNEARWWLPWAVTVSLFLQKKSSASEILQKKKLSRLLRNNEAHASFLKSSGSLFLQIRRHTYYFLKK